MDLDRHLGHCRSPPPCLSSPTARSSRVAAWVLWAAPSPKSASTPRSPAIRRSSPTRSYAGQIVTFTFPHIGNIGTNDEDLEDLTPAARHGAVGAVFKAEVTSPSNYRAKGDLHEWLKRRGVVAMSGIDTRALTALIREEGMPNAVIAHAPDGVFDLADLKARAGHGTASSTSTSPRTSPPASRRCGAKRRGSGTEGYGEQTEPAMHVVAVDYGIKRNILQAACRCSAPRSRWCRQRPSSAEILAMQPDGVFLSNGPGDPAATGEYAVPVIQDLLENRPAGLRHLPRPPDAGAGARRQDREDAPGPSRRQPPGRRTTPPARSRSCR